MSILVENECGWVICHEKSVEDIYTSVNIGSQGLKENLKYKADLFNIRVPYYYMMEDSHVTPNCVVSADVKPNRVSAGVKLKCVLDAEEKTNCELEAEVKLNCVLAAEVKPNCESAEVKPNCVLATEGNTNCVPAAEGKPNCVLSAESNLNSVLAAEVKPDCVLAAEMKPNCVSAAGTQNVGNADATHRKRKRKRKEPLNEGEIAAICFHEENKGILENALTSLVQLARDSGYFQSSTEKIKGESNKRSRALAAEVGSKISFADVFMQNQNKVEGDQSADGICVIENNVLPSKSLVGRVWDYRGDEAMAVTIWSERFLLPPRSRFLLSDIRGLWQNCHNLGKFNLIVMDPPWQNRSAKRNKMYRTMKNEDLLGLPIGQLAEDNCLIVVWATNKQAQHKFIQEHLFPAWKVEFFAQWFWLKVTKSGEPVNELDSAHKKPYESIIIGHCCKDKAQCDHSKIPNKKVIISVPCALHSKKPPLGEFPARSDTNQAVQPQKMARGLKFRIKEVKDVLENYLPCEPRCLELFARNLWDGWTSWGDEVLLHQHVDIFESVT